MAPPKSQRVREIVTHLRGRFAPFPVAALTSVLQISELTVRNDVSLLRQPGLKNSGHPARGVGVFLEAENPSVDTPDGPAPAENVEHPRPASVTPFIG